MTNEQSATLLRLNKQAQVAALNAVGFSDVTENSRASEFGQRIKWAAGLLDLHLACNRISDNSKAYFTAAEWNSLTLANKQLYIRCQQTTVHQTRASYPCPRTFFRNRRPGVL